MPNHPHRLTTSLAAGGAALASLAGATGASAATFTVDAAGDTAATDPVRCTSPTVPGTCTLRDAVAAADADLGVPTDTILFSSALSGSTITLTEGEIAIGDGLSIEGPGRDNLTVSGNDASRILAASGADLSISGLTFTGGFALNGGALAVLNGNELIVDEMGFIGNEANFNGGAIHGTGASTTLIVSDSEFVDNQADSGGAIETVSEAAASVSGSTFTSNEGNGFGGGAIEAFSVPSLTISNSTFTDNEADAYSGGAVNFYGDSLIVAGATFTGNQADQFGGALIYSPRQVGGRAQISNTISSGNTAPNGADFYYFPGAPNPSGIDLEFSLISEVGMDISYGPDTLIGVDPQLGTLTDNGGPTPTIAPAPTSPVIDAGSSGTLTTDQRGFTRPSDFGSIPNSDQPGADNADMGAVELIAPTCDDTIDNDADGQVDFPNDPGCDSATDDDETTPPDPDTEVTDADVSADKKQKQGGKRIKVKIKGGAQEQVTGVAKGKITVKGSKKKFPLKKVTKTTGPGKQTVYRLKLKKKKDDKKVFKLLTKGKKVRSNPSLKLTDAAGNSVTEKRVVRLKLKK